MAETRAPTDVPLVCLMGPTGAGKSAVALALAREFPVEIVSVDSALVYRGMDIGTAKPTPFERRAIPHHLVDICDPGEAYSAARFRTDALRAIAAIRARGRVPLLVGGTGLYFKALQQGLTDLPAAPPDVRHALQAELAARGSVALHARLATLDPARAARIHPHDPQRILRALEIHATSGRTMSAWLADDRPGPPMPMLNWVLAPADRAVLHTRVEQRFHAMLERGFVNEVAALRARGDLGPDTPAMRAVGYRAVWRYLAGELTREAMVEAGVAATRQLAKRQFTWFRALADATWWDSADRMLMDRLRAALAARTAGAFVAYT